MTARAAGIQSRVRGKPIRAPCALADHPKVVVDAVAVTADGVPTNRRPPLDERRRSGAGTRCGVHEQVGDMARGRRDGGS